MRMLAHVLPMYLAPSSGNTLHSLQYLWPIISSLLNQLDPNTLDQSFRVANLATVLAEPLDDDPDLLEKVYIAALLHDVGKMCIAQTILNKPCPLTQNEQQLLRQHTPIGAWLLEFYRLPAPIIEMVRFHHEKFDGSGYPNQLARNQIPDGAQLIAVADSYDAMTSVRCYRPRVSAQEARNEIVKCAGSYYDPRIVQTLYRLGRY